MTQDSQPKFWEDIIRSVPSVVAAVNNWQAILSEFESQIEETKALWLWSVPRVTISRDDLKSPDSTEDIKLYSGDKWKIMPAGVAPESAEFLGLGEELGRRVVKMKTKMPYEEGLKKLQETLPFTSSLFSDYSKRGELNNAVLSVLSPGTTINPHRGDPSIMRIHIGLKCDPNCSITVGNEDVGYESRTWSPGGVVAFRDGGDFCHSVVHNGKEDRWILMFDIPIDYLKTVVDNRYL